MVVFFWWQFSGRELSGGNHQDGNFLGESFHVTIVTGKIYRTGNYSNHKLFLL